MHTWYWLHIHTAHNFRAGGEVATLLPPRLRSVVDAMQPAFTPIHDAAQQFDLGTVYPALIEAVYAAPPLP